MTSYVEIDKYGIDYLGFLRKHDLQAVFAHGCDDGSLLSNETLGKALFFAQPVTEKYVLSVLNRIRRPQVQALLEKLKTKAEETDVDSLEMSLGSDQYITKILQKVEHCANSGEIVIEANLFEPIAISAPAAEEETDRQFSPHGISGVCENDNDGQQAFDVHTGTSQDVVNYWAGLSMRVRRQGLEELDGFLDFVGDSYSLKVLEIALDDFADTEVRRMVDGERGRYISEYRHRLCLTQTALIAIAERDDRFLSVGEAPLPDPSARMDEIANIDEPRISVSLGTDEHTLHLLKMYQINKEQGVLALESYCDKYEDPFTVWGLGLVMDGYHTEQIRKMLSHRIDALVRDFNDRLRVVEEYTVGMRSNRNPRMLHDLACAHLPQTPAFPD
ncbi:hypothetical protein V5T82_15130 [Magnetovibrio sp. PR-2]|uniref:hypothetical protein n=1 Tax=Magnetovibrio sp. PR-2 TaxID=3120356 RepID=UPI002FCDF388